MASHRQQSHQRPGDRRTAYQCGSNPDGQKLRNAGLPPALLRLTSAEGKTLRSDTMFIKHNGKLVGMLCINFDDSRYLAASEMCCDCVIRIFLSTTVSHRGRPNPVIHSRERISATTESFHNSIDAVAGDDVAGRPRTHPPRRNRRPSPPDRRMQIIASLRTGGIFLLKARSRCG